MRLFWYYAEQFADVLGSSGYPFHSLFRSIRAILYCRELVSSHDIDSQSSQKEELVIRARLHVNHSDFAVDGHISQDADITAC